MTEPVSPKEKFYVDKFWSRLTPKNENGCRLWQGTINGYGYGMVSWFGQVMPAHRLAYMLAHGYKKLPRKTLICHHCDVRACCEPEHLFAGDGRANQLDAARKRRLSNQDDRCSEQLVRRIRAMAEADIRDNKVVGSLMVETGLSQNQIFSIHTRRTYAWIED